MFRPPPPHLPAIRHLITNRFQLLGGRKLPKTRKKHRQTNNRTACGIIRIIVDTGGPRQKKRAFNLQPMILNFFARRVLGTGNIALRDEIFQQFDDRFELRLEYYKPLVVMKTMKLRLSKNQCHLAWYSFNSVPFSRVLN